MTHTVHMVTISQGFNYLFCAVFNKKFFVTQTILIFESVKELLKDCFSRIVEFASVSM